MSDTTRGRRQQAVWRLQDRIEAGTLTPQETKAVSQLVGAIGALGDTDDRADALGKWMCARELLAIALGEQPGGAA
jgi:hypothetical protein